MLIPFMMVYRPELMLSGSLPGIGYQIGVCWAAVVAISSAAIGYLLGQLGWLAQAICWRPPRPSSFRLFADLAGIALIAAFLAWQWQRRCRGASAPRHAHHEPAHFPDAH